ncbi:hypothetical protein PHMEG_00018562 [Phytophthora megakarya]|uniref:Uncharacterized protein n=1 Tax=Phytophthora megakarya TaxID=4795 RepID=A0A225VTU0_9STRA|nr:hypothetical protein PHMEG_00018562 [Phytophthora megakarya]
MVITPLVPVNSKKSRSTAIKPFITFLSTENMELDAAQSLIDGYKTGKVLCIMLDKYTYFLARADTKFCLPTLLYTSASNDTNYTDAALVVVLLFLYGRSVIYWIAENWRGHHWLSDVPKSAESTVPFRIH